MARGSKRDALLSAGATVCRSNAPLSVLTGSELLTRIKDMGDASKSDLVRECGYVSTKKDGTERLNFTAFYEAVLEAKGLSLSDHGRAGKPGRALSFMTHVQFNGNLMVGKAYTQQLGFKPGDSFEIKLSKKQIRLVQIDTGSNDTTTEDHDSNEIIDLTAETIDENQVENEYEHEYTEDQDEQVENEEEYEEETLEYTNITAEEMWTSESETNENSTTDEAPWSEDEQNITAEEIEPSVEYAMT